jgi:hypothetical protein
MMRGDDMSDTTRPGGRPNEGAGERARSAAHDAGDQARGVADRGKEQAGRMAHEVTSQTSHLVDEAGRRARDRAGGQVHHLAGVLGEMGDDLERMADEARSETPLRSLARDGATAMHSMSRRLEDDGFDGVLDDVRGFARRRPGLFVAGAFGLGLIGGRLIRNTDLHDVAEHARDGGSHDGAGGDGVRNDSRIGDRARVGAGVAGRSDAAVERAAVSGGVDTGPGWDTGSGARR